MTIDDEPSNPSSLPSYSEMILAAIETLDDKNGSDRTAISNYIESKYADQLTEAHSSLLTANLERMKESGEIAMAKDTGGYYMKAAAKGSDAPQAQQKRGRGRPPKVRPEGAPTPAVSASPRPRGRPPKARDPLDAAVAKATGGLPRPRGRPPKKARVDGETPATAAAVVAGVKRGRGRPPKVKMPFADVGFA